jgi:hypothetical protein
MHDIEFILSASNHPGLQIRPAVSSTARFEPLYMQIRYVT